MTPWGLRKRLKAWIFDQLVGEMLNADEPEAEPEPGPAGERVEVMGDDVPMLTDEAQAMIALPAADKASIAAPEVPPLTGSVDERLARLRLR